MGDRQVPIRPWTTERARNLLADLVKPGLLGHFDSVDLIEIVATPPGRRTLNVFSIAALEEKRSASVSDLPLAGRIKVDGFKDWSFGTYRSQKPLKTLTDALEVLDRTGTWQIGSNPLGVGALRAQPALFVPPDGTATVPINRLLKNNFWSGSYVFRLLDPDKQPFGPFFEDPLRLEALAQALRPNSPVALAGLTDFLGDILIQVPVTAVVAEFRTPRSCAHLEVHATWHPTIAERPLRAAARMRSDQSLTGAAVSDSFTTSAVLPLEGHLGPVETELWDVETGLLMAATASTSTLQTIIANFAIAEHEPRVFTAFDASGNPTPARVALTHNGGQQITGRQPTTDAEYWLLKRREQEEADRLAATREFVQYRPRAGDRSERERALTDIRWLIKKHGRAGVDLWDPYLNADDLLLTLFWSPHFNGPLRALTDGGIPPAPCTSSASDPPGSQSPATPAEGTTSKKSFEDAQRDRFNAHSGNREGLRLEYRIRRGPEGWAFHDRFLIFPDAENGPSAWSLGTSVNSLGLSHHILQRVGNPALILRAFEDLWTSLAKPKHLIWKSW
ncbi:MAG TPA: VPA1262 family N-terminal domain-containing protein [Allosphingosinicella sp.]